MQGWIEGFQESIDYIERNLSESLEIERIAEKRKDFTKEEWEIYTLREAKKGIKKQKFC